MLYFANQAGTIAPSGRSLSGLYDEYYNFSGTALTIVGDMNRDGIVELGVGQDWQMMQVMFNTAGTSPDDVVMLRGIQDVDPTFGNASTGGDVNGDGLADLIVSAADNEHVVGRITVFYGDRTSRILSPSQTHIEAPTGTTGFGRWLSAGL